MASTFSTNLAIELIGTGDQAGTWGTTTNSNLGTLIEQAISGYVTQAVATGTDTTITIPNGSTGVARNMYIELTGTGGTNTNLIVPANKKLYFIFNNSTGAVTVKVSGQTGVSVPTGKKMVLVSNGTDIVNGLNYIADFGTNSFSVTNLTASSATITNLIATSGSITNLVSSDASATVLRAGSATLTHLSATSASITNLALTSLTISSLSITNVSVASATVSSNLTLSGGTANGVLYLNGSKVATSGSALTFDGTNFGTTGNANLGSGSKSTDTQLNFASDLGTQRIYLDRGTRSLVFYDATTAIENYRIAGITGVQTWGVGGSEQMRLNSTGLGIGTSSPGTILDLGTSTGQKISVYRNANIRYGFGIETDTMRYYVPTGASNAVHSFGQISTTDGTTYTERLRLDSSGNLGLGVTPSAWQSGVKAFQNGAGALYTINTVQQRLSLNAYRDSAGTMRYINSSINAAEFRMGEGDGSFQFHTAASGTAGNTISFTQAMTLDANGNFVLGTTSALSSSYRITSYGGRVNFAGNNDALNLYLQYSNGTAGVFIGSPAANVLAFSDSNGTERARIDASGNLDLGTTGGSDRYQNIIATSAKLTFNAGTGFTGSAATSIYNQSAIAMVFGTNNTERARITSGGDLLVGTTSSGGTASNITRVTGGIFSTFNATPSIANNTATTVATLSSGEGMYLVSASLLNSGGAADWNELALVRVSQSNTAVSTIVGAANLDITVSGLDVQVTQRQGSTQTIPVAIIRLL